MTAPDTERTEDAAWVVAADMGLGHQRAAYPLRHLARGGVLTAGAPDVTSPEEERLWNRVRRTYDFLSRSRRIPLIGKALYGMLHAVEDIERLYPIRDLSPPSPQVHLVKRVIVRNGLGRALIETLAADPLPLVTTFYLPALAADYLGYPGPIYCVVCDADINRVWVADRPRQSRIRYLAPCDRVVRRLRMYGVHEEAIHLTGFPLPMENVGAPGAAETLRRDLLRRLSNLDPEGACFRHHRAHMQEIFGADFEVPPPGPPALTFAIGGAGAQTEIADALLQSLGDPLRRGEVTLMLSAGTRPDVLEQLEESLRRHNLEELRDRGVSFVFDEDRERYFDLFNRAMRATDLLWTKPSELTFYSGLGIPIVMAPPIGPHEVQNRRWLRRQYAGIDQEDPRYAAEWIRDLLADGHLAESAWQGYLRCPRYGTLNIERLITRDGA